MKSIDNIKDLIEFIRPYYPDINVNDYTIVEIEQALFHIYIKLIGKIMYCSPEHMRNFLQNYLMKFEITNIKQIIFSLITGMSLKERKKRVNFLVEKYLDHEELINNLLEKANLDEIQFFMRNTMYNKAIREGILYFKTNNEIFVLEGFLDKLYYENLMNSVPSFNKHEKDMIDSFIRYITEIYNLRIISRGIVNNIDRKILEQFLISNYLFLDENRLLNLLKFDNLESFYSELEKLLKRNEKLRKFRINTEMVRKHFIWSLQNMYQDYYFQEHKIRIDDIDFSTIYKILELIIKKDKEIKFNIMPNVIRIIHEKYERLEKLYGDF